MNFVRNFATFEDGASTLRVEITVKKIRTMLTTLNEIWVIGSEFFFWGGDSTPLLSQYVCDCAVVSDDMHVCHVT